MVYQGGEKPATQEEGMAERAKWQAWAEDLGSAMVNPGTPAANPKIVISDAVKDDAGPNAISGYSILQADNMASALEAAKACPFLDMKGASLTVAELMNM